MLRLLTFSLLVSGFSILLFSVFSSPALATFSLTSFSCIGSGDVVLCDEFDALQGSETTTGVVVSGIEVLVAGKVGSEEIHTVCTGATWKSTAVSEPLVAELEFILTVNKFTGCKLLEPLGKKCSVPPELKTANLVGTTTSVTGIKLAPEAGTTFMEIELKNNGTETCPATIKGIKKLVGEQTCENVSPEVLSKEKELRCSETGSQLLLNESPADLKVFFLLSLASFNLWDFGVA